MKKSLEQQTGDLCYSRAYIPCYFCSCTQLQKRSEQVKKSLEQLVGNFYYSRWTFHVVSICVHSSRRGQSRWRRAWNSSRLAIYVTAEGHSMLYLFVSTAPEDVGADEKDLGAADWQCMLQQRDIPCYTYLCRQLQKRSEQMKKSLEQQIDNLCYSRGTFHVISICVHCSRRGRSR